MNPTRLLPLLLATAIPFLSACKENPNPGASASNVEHYSADEKAAAAKLKPVDDPVSTAMAAFRGEMRNAFDRRDFDLLEQTASQLRASKETYANGRWKLVQFYNAFDCPRDASDAGWTTHERLIQGWIAARPQSITPRITHAIHLVQYAWRARGTGFVDSVTDDGARLFAERLASALKILVDSRDLPEKDICWWFTALQVARGQGWPKEQYDRAVEDAKKLEPKFWGFDAERAFSLLPRWYGEPGDWEAYAEAASARPDGVGAETYARIVIYLRGFHDNIFRESKASWPRIREGLALMRERYPAKLEMISHTAMLATMAEDQALAKEMFDQLGDTYYPDIWRKPDRFVHYRNWATTGQW
jgi:hypothetical protein